MIAGCAGKLRAGAARLRQRHGGSAWLVIVVAGMFLVVMALLPASSSVPGTVVAASLPCWNIGHGTDAVLAHRGDFTEVSPFMYGLAGDGTIKALCGPRQAAAVIARLRAAGLLIVPTLANIAGGSWSYQPVARILDDQALMREHVAAIAELVKRHGYAGIDIAYRYLSGSDRRNFTRFVTALAAALHADGKLLSVTVLAQTAQAGSGPGSAAQDYSAIGRSADQVRVSAYDFHWGSSGPGPVAPISWIRAVLRYAKRMIPARKIILGIPLYGYDWSNGHGTAVSWLRAFRLSIQYHAPAHYDQVSQAPWFGYVTRAGARHVVWFENAASSGAKFGAAQGAGIGGVYVWMFGYEDTGTWSALPRMLPTSRPAPRGSP